VLTPDVNVLVDAFREDSPHHGAVAAWLQGLVDSHESFALFESVLAGFLRVATHPRIFDPPTPLEAAIEFSRALAAQPNCVILRPGERHWGIFLELALRAEARGNLIADAYLAALTIEAGCTLVTSDRDFARFEGLRWQLPRDIRPGARR
jgi:toxin-antitoxin system PIN domain toxin